jgi:hypothetical protein
MGRPRSESLEVVREIVSTTQAQGTVAVKTTWEFEREDILEEIRCLNLDRLEMTGMERAGYN